MRDPRLYPKRGDVWKTKMITRSVYGVIRGVVIMRTKKAGCGTFTEQRPVWWFSEWARNAVHSREKEAKHE